VLIWIFTTLSDIALPYVIGCRTAMAAWSILEKKFANVSRAHTMQLKARLQNTTKGERSVSDYIEAIQEIVDQLAVVGQPIADEDLVLHMLHGLPSEYDAFATSIRVQCDAITAEDLHSLVLSEEVTVNERVRSVTQPDYSPHALYTSSSSKISDKQIYINQIIKESSKIIFLIFNTSDHPIPVQNTLALETSLLNPTADQIQHPSIPSPNQPVKSASN